MEINVTTETAKKPKKPARTPAQRRADLDRRIAIDEARTGACSVFDIGRHAAGRLRGAEDPIVHLREALGYARAAVAILEAAIAKLEPAAAPTTGTELQADEGAA